MVAAVLATIQPSSSRPRGADARQRELQSHRFCARRRPRKTKSAANRNRNQKPSPHDSNDQTGPTFGGVRVAARCARRRVDDIGRISSAAIRIPGRPSPIELVIASRAVTDSAAGVRHRLHAVRHAHLVLALSSGCRDRRVDRRVREPHHPRDLWRNGLLRVRSGSRRR